MVVTLSKLVMKLSIDIFPPLDESKALMKLSMFYCTTTCPAIS